MGGKKDGDRFSFPFFFLLYLKAFCPLVTLTSLLHVARGAGDGFFSPPLSSLEANVKQGKLNN
jgi:hypothetical protein